ncbi:hypothetical protein A2671_02310 [Candidatus Kaiserbacteria bacterium RIFCSPHIGHO2_01_FULL_49_13]|uniref:Uncharacterized protein n=1 Tax=Candidatus Kaiserbacteria bacterium RIFCSPHIGHO2_01_FULL_49_13 TaxID=1798477 RepID=A0A1F6CDP1_9BACT|nr:MAG: hypothetical protein A2671_02310 [Candidatus Kaiserbacteria bacterium RIFCSPHIGHO2_01_FULL_49_13]
MRLVIAVLVSMILLIPKQGRANLETSVRFVDECLELVHYDYDLFRYLEKYDAARKNKWVHYEKHWFDQITYLFELRSHCDERAKIRRVKQSKKKSLRN